MLQLRGLWGHQAKECPSEKRPYDGKGHGKGDGKRGKGEGKGKGGYLGKGGKSDGNGKSFGEGGYKGASFTCGQVGRKALECRRGDRSGRLPKRKKGRERAGGLRRDRHRSGM